MKSKSKMRRAFRLAPVAASLAALALVAACARTNGKAPITAETKAKIVDKIKSTIPDYDASAPANIALAARVMGASVVINNQSDTAVDATVKIVMTDKPEQIARGTIQLNNPGGAFFRLQSIDGSTDQTLIIQARCESTQCSAISAELILQVEQSNTSAAVATTTIPTAQVPAGDLGQADLPEGVTVAKAPPAADASPSAAPAEAAPKTMTIVAKDLMVFTIQEVPSKPLPTADDSKNVTKAVPVKTMKVEFMGPSPAGTNLMSFEDAYMKRWHKAYVETPACTPADLENERDGENLCPASPAAPVKAAPAAATVPPADAAPAAPPAAADPVNPSNAAPGSTSMEASPAAGADSKNTTQPPAALAAKPVAASNVVIKGAPVTATVEATTK
jgi:hypothetical protein